MRYMAILLFSLMSVSVEAVTIPPCFEEAMGEVTKGFFYSYTLGGDGVFVCTKDGVPAFRVSRQKYPSLQDRLIVCNAVRATVLVPVLQAKGMAASRAVCSK